MGKLFKPMLAPNEIPTEEFIASRLPLLASYKLDGIRCTVQGGQLLSRSLKPLPNKFLQERFASMPEGTDGELVQGIEQDNETFKRSHKIVMKADRPLDFFGDTLRLHVFDKFGYQGFRYRLALAHAGVSGKYCVVPVKHVEIFSMDELATFEKQALGLGYEGVMLRSLDGPYKQGRATLNQGWLMKLKRRIDAEAKVLSCFEEMENTNEEFTNELGRTARSSAKDGKVGKAQLGGFNVVGINGAFKDVEFRVSSSSITHDERKILWEGRKELEGQYITYTYQSAGSDEKPRGPVFKGVRSVEDL